MSTSSSTRSGRRAPRAAPAPRRPPPPGRPGSRRRPGAPRPPRGSGGCRPRPGWWAVCRTAQPTCRARGASRGGSLEKRLDRPRRRCACRSASTGSPESRCRAAARDRPAWPARSRRRSGSRRSRRARARLGSPPRRRRPGSARRAAAGPAGRRRAPAAPRRRSPPRRPRARAARGVVHQQPVERVVLDDQDARLRGGGLASRISVGRHDRLGAATRQSPARGSLPESRQVRAPALRRKRWDAGRRVPTGGQPRPHRDGRNSGGFPTVSAFPDCDSRLSKLCYFARRPARAGWRQFLGRNEHETFRISFLDGGGSRRHGGPFAER